jgi:hypothetical protein
MPPAGTSAKYDLFISHASEDKNDFVRPLAEALRRFGVSVWYDEFSLEIGDSLSRSIDRGLSESRFGLVVLSRAFLMKSWPEYELRGLTAKEIGREKVILPVWHGIDRDELLSYSPPLADKYALNSHGQSATKLACSVISVVRPDLFQKIMRRVAFQKIVRRAQAEKVETKKLKFAPPRHERLPLNLVSRIRLIRAALLGVYTHSMDYWVDGFRSDAHPSREIRIWEHIAACYVECCAMNRLTADQRQAVFDALSAISCGTSMQEVNERAREELSAEIIEQLSLLWSSPGPPFEVPDEPFPSTYVASSADLKSLALSDKEHFPYDVPDELIQNLIAEDED